VKGCLIGSGAVFEDNITIGANSNLLVLESVVTKIFLPIVWHLVTLQVVREK